MLYVDCIAKSRKFLKNNLFNRISHFYVPPKHKISYYILTYFANSRNCKNNIIYRCDVCKN